jgi:hypothetical protein
MKERIEMSSLAKSRLFTLLALGILLYWFVIPAILTHNVVEMGRQGKGEQLSPLTVKAWDYYQNGRYVSPNIPKEDANNLKKMIEDDMELNVVTAPIWYVSLEAPNYPKDAFPEGIPVFYHFDGFSGDVHEMNTINHYIGMDPMERGAPYLRMLAPYALIFVAWLFAMFMIYNSRIWNLLMLIPISLPVIFIGFYSYWLYWCGLHMHDWGAFIFKPFTPTVVGDGKVAQFTTHSYPTLGFWLLVAIAVLSILALAAKRKYQKQQRA